jgi:hypothetical protein
VGIDPDLDVGYASAAAFLDPVLASATFAGRWDNVQQRWSEAER